MTTETTQQTIAQALRTAGWVEDTYKNLRDEEIAYTLTAGLSIRGGGAYGDDVQVLRAPRPEPEYAPGTVARGRIGFVGQEHNMIRMGGGTWRSDLHLTLGDSEIEVLRVIADPDGNPPKAIEYPTLTTIQATERSALDTFGHLWRWEPIGRRFERQDGHGCWLATSAAVLSEAAHEDYFTRWATEDEVEQA